MVANSNRRPPLFWWIYSYVILYEKILVISKNFITWVWFCNKQLPLKTWTLIYYFSSKGCEQLSLKLIQCLHSLVKTYGRPLKVLNEISVYLHNQSTFNNENRGFEGTYYFLSCLCEKLYFDSISNNTSGILSEICVVCWICIGLRTSSGTFNRYKTLQKKFHIFYISSVHGRKATYPLWFRSFTANRPNDSFNLIFMSCLLLPPVI